MHAECISSWSSATILRMISRERDSNVAEGRSGLGDCLVTAKEGIVARVYSSVYILWEDVTTLNVC